MARAWNGYLRRMILARLFRLFMNIPLGEMKNWVRFNILSIGCLSLFHHVHRDKKTTGSQHESLSMGTG